MAQSGLALFLEPLAPDTGGLDSVLRRIVSKGMTAIVVFIEQTKADVPMSMFAPDKSWWGR